MLDRIPLLAVFLGDLLVGVSLGDRLRLRAEDDTDITSSSSLALVRSSCDMDEVVVRLVLLRGDLPVQTLHHKYY